MQQDLQALVSAEIKNLLEETFELHHGIYLNKGTSLFETLETIDHKKASIVLPGLQESIAGHVYHARFYIKVLIEYITGTRTGKTDWNESWIIKEVNRDEWHKIVEELRSEYENLRSFIENIQDWSFNDNFGGVIAILIHCAYHLAAIRQIKDIKIA